MLPAAGLNVPAWVKERVAGINWDGPCIGRGTFGKVFSGRCVISGKPLAVKRLFVPPHQQTIFADEVNCYRRLAAEPHANCLSVSAWFWDRTAGEAALIMPAGMGNLMGLLNSQAHCLQDDLVQTFANQLALAIRHIHLLEIIHRDIKPANLLIVWSCGAPLLQLAGFGASRMRHARPEMTPGLVTEWYRAPEVFKFTETCGAAVVGETYSFPADVWSLGCVVGEMVHREMLFKTFCDSEAAVLAVMAARLGQPATTQLSKYMLRPARWPPVPTGYPPINLLSEMAATVPAALSAGADLVAQCLCWDPSCRITAAGAAEHCFCKLAMPASAGPSRLGNAVLSVCVPGGEASSTATAGQPPACFAGGVPAGRRPTPGGKAAGPKTRVVADDVGVAGAGRCGRAAKNSCLSLTSSGITEIPTAPPPEAAAAPGSQTTACQCQSRCNAQHPMGNCSRPAAATSQRGLCQECTCLVSSCSQPRMRGSYCWYHGYLYLPAEMQLTRVFGRGGLLPQMIPADIQAYLAAEPQLFGDWAMDLLAAWFTEPLAIRLLVAHRPMSKDYSVVDLERALLAVRSA